LHCESADTRFLAVVCHDGTISRDQRHHATSWRFGQWGSSSSANASAPEPTVAIPVAGAPYRLPPQAKPSDRLRCSRFGRFDDAATPLCTKVSGMVPWFPLHSSSSLSTTSSSVGVPGMAGRADPACPLPPGGVAIIWPRCGTGVAGVAGGHNPFTRFPLIVLRSVRHPSDTASRWILVES
jgi:hypothetical protein